MVSKRQDLETRLIASDDASKVIDKVAGKLDDLEKQGDTAITLSADDQASDEVKSLSDMLGDLSDEDKTIVLKARMSEAQRDVDRLLKSLAHADDMDGEEVRIRVEALGDAKEDLEKLEDQMRDLDGTTAEVSVEAKGLDELTSKLGALPGSLGQIAGSLGSAGGIVAGAGALAGSMFAAADHAADMAVNVATIQELTGLSVDEASRLMAVWQTTGADVGDLNDVILQMNGVLQDSPELAEQIGVNLADGLGPGQRFVDVMEKIRDFTGTAAERATLMSKLLGEEGARQGAKLLAVVDDIGQAMLDLPEGVVLTQEEVDKALDMKAAMAELKLEIEAVAVEFGQAVLPALEKAVELINQLDKVDIFEIPFVTDSFTQGERDMREKLEAINEAGKDTIRVFTDLGGGGLNFFDNIADSVGKAGDAVAQVHIDEDMKHLNEVQDEYTRTLQRSVKEGINRVVEAQEEYRTSLEEQAEAIDGSIGALEREQQILEDNIEALEAQNDARRALADGIFSLHDAEAGLEEAQRGVAETSKEIAKDGKITAAELYSMRDAYESVVESAVSVADAHVQLATDQAAARGKTLDATKAIDLQNESLLEQAAQLEGPQQTALLEYIAQLNGIPEDKATYITALIEQGRLDEAEELLNNTSRTRKATIEAEADKTKLTETEQLIDELTKTREAIVDAIANIGTAEDDLDYLTQPRTVEITPLWQRPIGVNPEGLAGGLSAGTTATTLLVAAPTARGATVTPTVVAPMAMPTVAGRPPATTVINVQLNTAVVGGPFDVMRAMEDTMRRVARLMPVHP